MFLTLCCILLQIRSRMVLQKIERKVSNLPTHRLTCLTTCNCHTAQCLHLGISLQLHQWVPPHLTVLRVGYSPSLLIIGHHNFMQVMRNYIFLHDPMSAYTQYGLFLALHCTVWSSCLSLSLLFSSFPGTLHFEQQVLLNPVIAISDEEIKAMQQFWGQNICFPTHLSLTLPQAPLNFNFY